jgi:hypothetical protein
MSFFIYVLNNLLVDYIFHPNLYRESTQKPILGVCKQLKSIVQHQLK